MYGSYPPPFHYAPVRRYSTSPRRKRQARSGRAFALTILFAALIFAFIEISGRIGEKSIAIAIGGNADGNNQLALSTIIDRVRHTDLRFAKLLLSSARDTSDSAPEDEDILFQMRNEDTNDDHGEDFDRPRFLQLMKQSGNATGASQSMQDFEKLQKQSKTKDDKSSKESAAKKDSSGAKSGSASKGGAAFQLQLIPSAVNPLETRTGSPRQHSHLLNRFGQSSAPFDAENIVDWLGIKTSPAYDCTTQYEALLESKPSGQTEGQMPVLDEEYFKYLQLLESAYYAYQNKNSRYVVVELGARYSTWGVRGATLMRRMNPSCNVRVVAIEPTGAIKWASEHAKKNNVKNIELSKTSVNSTESFAEMLIKISHGPLEKVSSSNPLDLFKHYTNRNLLETAVADSPAANASTAEENQTAASNNTISENEESSHPNESVIEVNEKYIIDFLGIDCQGCEQFIMGQKDEMSGAFMEDARIFTLLASSVRRLYITTHTNEIHETLRNAFTGELGIGNGIWALKYNFPRNPRFHTCDKTVSPPNESFKVDQSCQTNTDWGPMYIRDGILALDNLKLLSSEDPII